ncbi:hypothetical protein [Sporosarcina sp. FSL K6-1508]|uniref:hypothetical protein n=1 Tax=Sporosarcina sp. FSL K6-1508 TaxID=2921553 RepID=UPI0030F7FF9F
MPKNTKLIKCKGHIEIFDYDANTSKKNFSIEQEGYVRLARIIRTNFKVQGKLTYAALTIPVAYTSEVKEQIEQWLSTISKATVAVLQPSTDTTILYVLTDNLPVLLAANNDISIMSTECHTAEVQDVINIFVQAFDTAIKGMLRKAKQFLIEHYLEEPLTLRNRKAEAFIEKHRLIDRTPYSTADLFDSGWFTVQRYII